MTNILVHSKYGTPNNEILSKVLDSALEEGDTIFVLGFSYDARMVLDYARKKYYRVAVYNPDKENEEFLTESIVEMVEYCEKAIVFIDDKGPDRITKTVLEVMSNINKQDEGNINCRVVRVIPKKKESEFGEVETIEK